MSLGNIGRSGGQYHSRRRVATVIDETVETFAGDWRQAVISTIIPKPHLAISSSIHKRTQAGIPESASTQAHESKSLWQWPGPAGSVRRSQGARLGTHPPQLAQTVLKACAAHHSYDDYAVGKHLTSRTAIRSPGTCCSAPGCKSAT